MTMTAIPHRDVYGRLLRNVRVNGRDVGGAPDLRRAGAGLCGWAKALALSRFASKCYFGRRRRQHGLLRLRELDP